LRDGPTQWPNRSCVAERGANRAMRRSHRPHFHQSHEGGPRDRG
jgi:hypothetical protein